LFDFFFTEIGTPCHQKVKHVHGEKQFTFSQPSPESDYNPQQSYIAKKDDNILVFLYLPNDRYMLKLIELTSHYRGGLQENCHRKSTAKSSSTSKYARNFYILCMFLPGDKR
jgi:hypothetical protein